MTVYKAMPQPWIIMVNGKITRRVETRELADKIHTTNLFNGKQSEVWFDDGAPEQLGLLGWEQN